MKLHLWIVRELSRIVPRRFRFDWQQEWEAEFHHRDSLGRRELLRRSFGSFWDALAMQPRRLEEEMFQDLLYGIRMIVKNKALSITVILTLALGIGANTALFSAINGMLLMKLPVPNPDTLVRFRWAGQNDMSTSRDDYGYRNREAGLIVQATFSYPMFQQFRKDNRALDDLFACAPMDSVNVIVDGHSEIASGFIASGNYHEILGGKALIGRTLTPADDDAAAPGAVVISEGYWKGRFGGDPGIIGKVVRANNLPVTIVGVMPAEFTGVQLVIDKAPDISFPLVLDRQLGGQDRMSRPTNWWLQIMGRLKPGTTAEQVQANLNGVFQQTARQGMDSYLASLSTEERAQSGNRDRTRIPQLRTNSGARGVYDIQPETLQMVTSLSIVVLLILVLVCANVANLLLSRVAARQKEMSVRLSLGATRLRLLRQLLTESVLLACVGSALGIVAAYWGRQLLPGAAGRAPMEWRVLIFATGLALLTGILFGLTPALRATARDTTAALKEHSRAVIGARTSFGKSLLVLQVAISLVLLIGAGLFLGTVENLRNVQIGFDPRNILLFRVDPRLNGYDQSNIGPLYARMIERLKAVPGIRSVSVSNNALLSGSESDTNIYIQGHPAEKPGPNNQVYQLTISPDFLETMAIPVLAGRGFTWGDNEKAQKVVMINEAAAHQFFPNESPLGRRIGTRPETSGDMEIVGVTRDAKYGSVRNSAPPTMYYPYLQLPRAVLRKTYVELRTAGDPVRAIAAVREAVRDVDPNLPPMDFSTQTDRIEQRFAQERLFARAYILFGGLALLVASVGLFGLMSYSVARRTSEIGIRMALGAAQRDILRSVMGESLLPVLVGIALGVGGALAFTRTIQSRLFGLSPNDPWTIAAAVLLLAAVAAFAGYLPARKASRVDPLVALRYE